MNSLIETSVRNKFDYYIEGRVFEWVMGISMIFVGIQFIIWPDTMGASAFRYLAQIVSQHTLTFILLFIGWSRCTALMLNGQKMFNVQMGPFVRAGAGILSSIIWAQFVMALVQLSITQGYPSPGIPFWAMFTVGELYAAYTTIKNR